MAGLPAAPPTASQDAQDTGLGAASPAQLRRLGARQAVPFALAAFLLGTSFGVLARQSGFDLVPTIVMSVVVNAGSAQFAAVAILSGGGSLPAALVAGGLMNGRFLPMGVAFGPSLPGGPLRRAVQGQAVVDASWALANLGDGRFERFTLFGATLIQYVGFTTGTALGAVAQRALGDLDRFGVDALYPAFFVALLVGELRTARGRWVAALAAVIALALAPLTPAGVPILSAGVVALVGLRPRTA